MLGRALEHFLCHGAASGPEVDGPDQGQRLGDPEVIRPSIEQSRVSLRFFERRLLHAVITHHADEQPTHARERLEPAVAEGPRPFDRLGEHVIRAWEVRPRQRQPQVREELYPERIPRGEQLGRSRQEVHRGREVPSRVRVVARGGEPLRRSVGERPRPVVERAELGAIPVRLLEVISDDLVALPQRPRRLVEPRREPLVELRSGRLRDRRVRLVADQQVSEPERVGRGQVGALGADDLLADQRSDAIGRIRDFARELADGGEVEDLPHHRCDLDQPAFRCGQLVQPRREQRRDRRWDGQVREIAGRRPSALLQDEPTLVDQEARDLLRVERVPLGGGGDALADHGIHRVIRQAGW